MTCCFLGLDCDTDTCPNRLTCYWWVKPWALPYTYSAEAKYLHIHSEGYGDMGFEDMPLDLSQVWHDYGFQSAVELPYLYVEEQSSFVVLRSTKFGFCVAWDLPYSYQILEDGCGCLSVSYNWLQPAYNSHVAKAGFLIGCPLNTDNLPF